MVDVSTLALLSTDVMFRRVFEEIVKSRKILLRDLIKRQSSQQGQGASPAWGFEFMH